MDRDEKIKEAQEVLNWAIMHLSLSFHSEVMDYKHENYRVQFFTKENKLIMPVQISEEWIKGSPPSENRIDDRLKALVANLANY